MHLEQILNFITHPEYSNNNTKAKFIQKIGLILLFISWIYAISIFTFVPLIAIYGGGTKNIIDGFVDNSTLLEIILIIVIFTPLLEEMAFRLPLRFTRFTLPVSFFLLTAVFIGSYLPTQIGIYSTEKTYLIACIIATILLFLIAIKYKGIFESFYLKSFRWILYTSIIFFAVIHFSNYTSIKGVPYILVPILVLPQLITGIVISYMRMKYGFIYGYITHMLYNLFIALISIPNHSNNATVPKVMLLIITIFGVLTLVGEIYSMIRKQRLP